MAVSSDTAVGEQLARNTSVTEPWVTSPRQDPNRSGNDKTNGNMVTTETRENSGKNDTAKPCNETVNNDTIKNDKNKRDTKQSSLIVDKPEPEPELKENKNDSNGTNHQEHSKEEVKPTLVGNVQKIETKSLSTESKGNVDAEPVNDDDLDMYDPELFITEEERKAFEYMIEQRRERIENDRVKFENWVDSLTRRRMFALSRLRKLKIGHGERSKLYGKVLDYVKEVESVLSAVPSSAKTLGSVNNSSTVQTSKPHSASPSANNKTSRQLPEAKEIRREITGFVNTPGSDTESTKCKSISNDNNNIHGNSFTKDESPKIVPVHS